MTNIFRKMLFGSLAICAFLLLGGCVPVDPDLTVKSLQLMSDFSQKTPPGIERLASDGQIADSLIATEQIQSSVVQTDSTDVAWTASITVKNSRVNIRGEPGLEHQPVTTADAGTSFKT